MNSGPETADGTLVIIVCRAKNLPNRRKLDKQCPYVTMRIGPTAKKTPSHFRAGQTPEWTHEIRFQLTRERKPIMKLDVLDETKNEPTPIGQVEIDCSIVFSNQENKDVGGKYIYDNWFDLTLNGKSAGKIYLEMTFYPSAPLLPPKITGQLMMQSHNYNEPVEYQVRAEQNVDLSQHHNLATSPPPVHPRRINHDEYKMTSAADEVFSNNITSTSSHKKLTLFLGASLSAHLHSAQNQPESFETTSYEVDFNNGDSPTKSKFKALTKLKLKFQSKLPIGSLYKPSRTPSPEKEPLDFYSSDGMSPSPSRGSGSHSRSKSSSPVKSYYNLPSHLIPSSFGPETTSPGIRYSDDEDDYEDDDLNYYQAQVNMPPNPPPHLLLGLNATRESGSTFASTFALSQLSNRSNLSSGKQHLGRKPPPPLNLEGELADKMHRMHLHNGNSTTEIPFSADTIGLDEPTVMPTKVYMFDKEIKSLSHDGHRDPNARKADLDPNQIDPRYYAPSPSEHLTKTFRLQSGSATKGDVQVDLHTESTGYLGNGKWQQSKFSPSVFDRMPSVGDFSYDEENKPKVPPKVPKGLTEIEYYVLEKEKYLKDINGRRA